MYRIPYCIGRALLSCVTIAHQGWTPLTGVSVRQSIRWWEGGDTNLQSIIIQCTLKVVEWVEPPRECKIFVHTILAQAPTHPLLFVAEVTQ